MMARTTGFDRNHRRCKFLEERHHLFASQLLAQNRCFHGIHPVKLENVLRRIHPNSANLVHGRSPWSEITQHDLILAHQMPSGAVHTNRSATTTSPGSARRVARAASTSSTCCVPATPTM